MKKYILSLIIVISFCSCIKEKSTISTTYFINNTNHTVVVNGYLNGNLYNESTFSLNPNQTKQISYFNNRGIGESMTFGGMNHPIDSFVVIFDNQYSISHYKPTLIGNNAKRYLYTSKRNIYNDSSYQSNLIGNSKYMREWEFKYTFVEQDYLDAR